MYCICMYYCITYQDTGYCTGIEYLQKVFPSSPDPI